VPDRFRSEACDAGVGSGEKAVLFGGQLLKILIGAHAFGS
jgi:hypothetical protein